MTRVLQLKRSRLPLGLWRNTLDKVDKLRQGGGQRHRLVVDNTAAIAGDDHPFPRTEDRVQKLATGIDTDIAVAGQFLQPGQIVATRLSGPERAVVDAQQANHPERDPAQGNQRCRGYGSGAQWRAARSPLELLFQQGRKLRKGHRRQRGGCFVPGEGKGRRTEPVQHVERRTDRVALDPAQAPQCNCQAVAPIGDGTQCRGGPVAGARLQFGNHGNNPHQRGYRRQFLGVQIGEGNHVAQFGFGLGIREQGSEQRSLQCLPPGMRNNVLGVETVRRTMGRIETPSHPGALGQPVPHRKHIRANTGLLQDQRRSRDLAERVDVATPEQGVENIGQERRAVADPTQRTIGDHQR